MSSTMRWMMALLAVSTTSAASSVRASSGVITPPMQVSGDHIVVPNGVGSGGSSQMNADAGRAMYRISAASDTTISIELEIRTRNPQDDSFFLWMDDNDPEVWHTGTHSSFTWRPRSFTVTAGLHDFYVGAREDGSELRALRIASGDASFVIAEESTTNSTDREGHCNLTRSDTPAPPAFIVGTWESIIMPSISEQSRSGARVATEGDVRLESNNAVMIYHSGSWKYVCDDSWGIDDAEVVCRQLGLGSASSAPTRLSIPSDSFWLDDVACRGSETRLSSCSASSWGSENCATSEGAGAICTGSSSSLTERRQLQSATEGDVRIESDNAVMVYHSGSWRYVCDDLWGIDDANVVCRQVGLGLASSAPTRITVADSFWLDNVQCSGSESSLSDCTSNEWGSENCGTTEGAGAVCTRSSPLVTTESHIRLPSGLAHTSNRDICMTTEPLSFTCSVVEPSAWFVSPSPPLPMSPPPPPMSPPPPSPSPPSCVVSYRPQTSPTSSTGYSCASLGLIEIRTEAECREAARAIEATWSDDPSGSLTDRPPGCHVNYVATRTQHSTSYSSRLRTGAHAGLTGCPSLCCCMHSL